MKQLLTFNPAFTPGTPGNGFLDFTSYPGFSHSRIYAIINATRSTPLYIAGATGYNAVISNTSPTIVRVVDVDTSSHSSTDEINIYYEAFSGSPITGAPTLLGQNYSMEQGGELQVLQEKLDAVLVELKLQNEILLHGLIGYPLGEKDTMALRNDITNVQNQDNINTQL